MNLSITDFINLFIRQTPSAVYAPPTKPAVAPPAAEALDGELNAAVMRLETARADYRDAARDALTTARDLIADRRNSALNEEEDRAAVSDGQIIQRALDALDSGAPLIDVQFDVARILRRTTALASETASPRQAEALQATADALSALRPFASAVREASQEVSNIRAASR